MSFNFEIFVVFGEEVGWIEVGFDRWRELWFLFSRDEEFVSMYIFIDYGELVVGFMRYVFEYWFFICLIV